MRPRHQYAHDAERKWGYWRWFEKAGNHSPRFSGFVVVQIYPDFCSRTDFHWFWTLSSGRASRFSSLTRKYKPGRLLNVEKQCGGTLGCQTIMEWRFGIQWGSGDRKHAVKGRWGTVWDDVVRHFANNNDLRKNYVWNQKNTKMCSQ